MAVRMRPKELVGRVHPIRNQGEANAVQKIVLELLRKGEALSLDERDLITVLGYLIAAWEEGRYEPIRLPANKAIQALLEDTGQKQADLVGPVFQTRSLASEVLSGKRQLTYEYVQKLSGFFHVSPELFFPTAEGNLTPPQP